MIRDTSLRYVLLLALGVCLATSGYAQQQPSVPPAKKPAKAPQKAPTPAVAPVLEPKAMEILKAASDRLAAAHAMRFTAVIVCFRPACVKLDFRWPTVIRMT